MINLAPIIPVLVASFLTCTILSRDKEQRKRTFPPQPLNYRHKNRQITQRTKLSNDYQPFQIWVKKARIVDQMKRHASVSILIFIAVYVLFSIPSTVCYVIYTIDTARESFEFDRRGFYFNNFVFHLLIPLNSMINPVIYFIRVKAFRDYLKRYLRKIFKYLRLPIYF